jgi:hypothetical protein
MQHQVLRADSVCFPPQPMGYFPGMPMPGPMYEGGFAPQPYPPMHPYAGES